MEVILSVEDLVIKFNLRGQVLTAIREASLELYEGDIVIGLPLCDICVVEFSK